MTKSKSLKPKTIEYLHQHPAIYEGLDYLLTKDPVFKKLNKRPEDFLRSYSGPGLSSMVRIVIGQQVSTSAAASIWQKFEANFKTLDAKSILKMEDIDLRALGLSGQKVKYIRGLCEAVHGKLFDPHALENASDEEVYAAITALKGFGPWSAEIYMMFSLARPDVWPIGDLGIQDGLRVYLKRKVRPTPEQTLKEGKRFAPYRTAASILLWHIKAHDDVAKRDANKKTKIKTKTKSKNNRDQGMTHSTDFLLIVKFAHELAEHARNGGRLHLVLDFDGTIADFNDNPEHVRASPTALRALYDIARHFNCVVTLATGRSVESIRRRLRKSPGMPLPFNIVGSDGAEWQGAGKNKPLVRHSHPQGSDILMAEFNRVAAELQAKNPGLVVEHKHGSLLFNVDCLDEKDLIKRRAVMAEIRHELAVACQHPAMPMVNGVPYFQLYDVHETQMGVHVSSLDKAFGLRQSAYGKKYDRLVFLCDSLHQNGNDRTTAIAINDKTQYLNGSVVQVLNSRSRTIDPVGAPETPQIVLRDVAETARFLKHLAILLNSKPPRPIAKFKEFH